MSEALKHECGIAMIRLLKPLEYYQQKYGTWQYGLNKLYLLMEKQHNRGQDGAGLAVVKLDSEAGDEFVFRERALGSGAIAEIFGNIYKSYEHISDEKLHDVHFAKEELPFAGELFLGHLRYSTNNKAGISYVHPFLRRNNWRSRNLALAGNFNITNVDELVDILFQQGQHPRNYSDTFVLLEMLGHALDREVQHKYDRFSRETELKGQELNSLIENNLDIPFMLERVSRKWDGGFVVSGLIGSGDAFVYRDPWGIRPAYYYKDDEIVVVASERPVIQTTMNLNVDDIQELNPGQAIIIKKNGVVTFSQIQEQKPNAAPCSFERIYFSRGSDADIYKERKELGGLLLPRIMKAIDNDIKNTVLSFIPNTAEVAFFGMTEAFACHMNEVKIRKIQALGEKPDAKELNDILSMRMRDEKVVIKDVKLRTFIAQDKGREDMAAHVYDVTYNSIRPYEDNLVVIDDSIVRGTTLQSSILKMLDRLHPKKIVVVASSPQIRYPDCYGIDMSKMEEFAAFRAAIGLLEEQGKESLIEEVYQKCLAQKYKPKEEIINHVKEIYEPFTDEDISRKMAEQLTPKEITTPVELVFQSIEMLHKACPNHKGDWYFSGNYPTAGGNRVANNAFIRYVESYRK